MKTIECPTCKGKGWEVYTGFEGEWVPYECDECDGEGTIDVPDCQEDLDELGIPASAEDLTDE
jgi:DnaJ-class molecular chaperone